MPPLYLGDIAPGDTFESEAHEMTQEAIIAFAEAFDPQPFHTDPVAAKDSFFGRLVASGWHTAAVTMRLMAASVPFAHGVIGGGGNLRWPAPVVPGDRLRLVTRIETVERSATRPGRAKLTALCRTIDQHGAEKQVFRPGLLAWDRGYGPKVHSEESA